MNQIDAQGIFNETFTTHSRESVGILSDTSFFLHFWQLLVALLTPLSFLLFLIYLYLKRHLHKEKEHMFLQSGAANESKISKIVD